MKFSVFHIAMGRGRSSDQQVYDDLLSDGALAEQLGFDVFWLAEHHFDANFSMSPSPNLLLAALASTTRTIKLGTSVNVLPFYQPIRLAEETAMLDLLSHGRFQWGIGRGIAAREMEPFQIAPAETAARFREVHDFVLHAWTSGDLGWHGPSFDVPAAPLVPAITQRPHPPIWMTAQTPSSVEWAAQHGYPAMQLGDTIDQVREQIDAYLAAAERAGRAPDERGAVVPLRYVFVAETEREAREIVAPHLMDWWRAFTRITAPPAPTQVIPGYEYWTDGTHSLSARFRGLDFDDLNEAGIIMVGTPDKVAELVQRHQAIGVQHIMCDFWRAGKAREDRQRSMRLFGEEVLPRVASAPTPAAV